MGGFSSISGDIYGSVVNALNASFDGTTRGGVLSSDGQFWIGATSANAGGTHINVGTLTSPDSSLTIGFSTPNITLQVAGGTTVGKTITGNTEGALPPTSGNWNIVTTGATVLFAGSGSTLTLAFGTPSNLILGSNPPSVSSANNNIGMGAGALIALTGAQQNCCFGVISGQKLTTGGGNCTIGYGTLQNLITGAQNIAIGQQTGVNYTTSESSNILFASPGYLLANQTSFELVYKEAV